MMFVLFFPFVNTRSGREMNEVRIHRQNQSRHGSHLVDGMTKKERAEYVKNALQTKVGLLHFLQSFTDSRVREN